MENLFSDLRNRFRTGLSGFSSNQGFIDRHIAPIDFLNTEANTNIQERARVDTNNPVADTNIQERARVETNNPARSSAESSTETIDLHQHFLDVNRRMQELSDELTTHREELILRDDEEKIIESKMMNKHIFNEYVSFIMAEFGYNDEDAIIFVKKNYELIHQIINNEIETKEIKNVVEQERIKKNAKFKNYLAKHELLF
jgi:hypothetical protein